MKSIIESVLNVGSHKEQCLALNNALSHPKLVNEAADFLLFLEKESKKVHYVMIYMEQQASILKISTVCKNKKERKIDHKQSFTNSYFVSIYHGQESKITSVKKITKNLATLRRTR